MDVNVGVLPETSEQFDIVLGQLMKAKQEMGSAVKRDAYNPFHKSKYAGLGAHLDLCEGVLHNHGLILLHTVNILGNSPVLIASLHHPESKQWTKSYFPLPNPKNDSQGVGASVTYMRRYSINAMLGLTSEDDDGETASGRGQYTKKDESIKKQAEIVKPKILPTQVARLLELERVLDDDCKHKIYDWLQKNQKINKIYDVLDENYQKTLVTFENAAKFMDQKKVEVAHA